MKWHDKRDTIVSYLRQHLSSFSVHYNNDLFFMFVKFNGTNFAVKHKHRHVHAHEAPNLEYKRAKIYKNFECEIWTLRYLLKFMFTLQLYTVHTRLIRPCKYTRTLLNVGFNEQVHSCTVWWSTDIWNWGDLIGIRRVTKKFSSIWSMQDSKDLFSNIYCQKVILFHSDNGVTLPKNYISTNPTWQDFLLLSQTQNLLF